MALLKVDFYSNSLMRTVTVDVILPVDKYSFDGKFSREEKSFKTLYLLHGIFGNSTDWITGTRIVKWAQNKNLAVIMPTGENKFYVDNGAIDENYGTYIGEELVEITRRMFPLSRKREDTFIGGLSMGGYGAFVNGLKYSDTFGSIIGLSSAFILDAAVESSYDATFPIDNKAFYERCFGDLDVLLGSDKDYRELAKRLVEKKAKPAIYMACGTEDFLIDENRKYREYLKELGIPHTYEEGPGRHDWEFWDTYIQKVLEWLPLEDMSEGISSGNVR